MSGVHNSSAPVVIPKTTVTSHKDVPDASTLTADHQVKREKGGISRVSSAISSAIKSAYQSLSKLTVAKKAPPPDSMRYSTEPFKSLGHAKGAFIHLCKEQLDVHDHDAQQKVFTANKSAKSLGGNFTNQEKNTLFAYTTEDSPVGYQIVNGLIRANLEGSKFATDKLDAAKKTTLANFDIEAMAARLPNKADQDKFRTFAETYVMCLMAQKATSAREGMAKLPLHQGITDRGMTDFPGKVDKLKAAISSPDRIKFTKEAAFFSSTAKIQTPDRLKDTPTNHAKFSNDITLLTIGRSGRELKSVSEVPGEGEVLFPSEARFEIFGHKEVQPTDATQKPKNVFFQVELSSEDYAALNTLKSLNGKMNANPSYKPNDAEKQALSHAKDFNTYVNTQMGEFAKLGWKGDLAPPLPQTCQFFAEVLAEAAQR